MARRYAVTGTLSKGRVIRLDVPVPLGGSRVRVSVEPLPAETPRPYIDVLTEIRRRPTPRGHIAPLVRRSAASVALNRTAGGRSRVRICLGTHFSGWS